MDTGGSLLVAIVIILIVTYYVVRWQLRRRKIATFRAFAAQRGWIYLQRDPNLTERFLGTPFGRGAGKQAEHVLAGQHRGRTLIAFEYSYKERHGSSRDKRRTVTYTHIVVALGTPAARPTLELRRAGLGRKLLGLVGIRDLELESEEFNKTFHIRTEDDRFAYAVLHPRTMEWMLADRRFRTLPFRFERADLVTWRQGVIDLENVVWMLDYLCDVLDGVPKFVWK